MKSAPKKPVKEIGSAYNAPIKWAVIFEHPDGSTTRHVVIAQTYFLARKEGAIRHGKLPSEVTAKPLTEAPPKEQKT